MVNGMKTYLFIRTIKERFTLKYKVYCYYQWGDNQD